MINIKIIDTDIITINIINIINIFEKNSDSLEYLI